MSDKRQFKHLGARLRAERPSPSSGLISAIVGRLPARVQRHPKASFRIALAAGLAVALVSAVTAVGGVGYAKTQVTHAVVAVKSSVKSTVTLSNSAAPTAKSASVVYKNPPIIRNVRTDPQDPGCPGTVLIIKGDNLANVTVIWIGGPNHEQGPILRQNIHTIVVKIEANAKGTITVIGTDGIGTYKKEFIAKKCKPKHK